MLLTDTDRLPKRNTERLPVLKALKALKEANTIRSRLMNKSSDFRCFLLCGCFAKCPWRAAFIHANHPPEASEGASGGFLKIDG
jgi:hypothetical protein